jgi:hypothetical protein
VELGRREAVGLYEGGGSSGWSVLDMMMNVWGKWVGGWGGGTLVWLVTARLGVLGCVTYNGGFNK